MEMGAIRDYYGTPEGVVASIKAGVDLAEISSAFDLELAAAKAVNEAAERGEFDVEEICASVEKILCYKKMLAAQAEPGLCNQPEDRRAAESMARQAISQISGTPSGRMKTPSSAAAPTIAPPARPMRTGAL